MKTIITAVMCLAGFAACGGNASWEITLSGTQAYISDGDWTFKAGLDNNRLRDVGGTVRAEGPYALTVGDCTVYPAAVTPLDFSKPLVNSTGNGREYAISSLTFKFGTFSGSTLTRVYTATAAGLVVGKLTLPTAFVSGKISCHKSEP